MTDDTYMDECPDCGGPLTFREGCKKCAAGCGFSLC